VNVTHTAAVPPPFAIKPAHEAAWDLVALGEVMLRLDPGDRRIHSARHLSAWEGGGEYNVARGLRRCFGLRTTIVTALADNPIGRLIEDLMLQGGVDLSHVRWVPYDGVGRSVRNGINFTERGFGLRAPLGCSDRGMTAVSQLRTGDVDWPAIFRDERARWFHSGGIFAGLSAASPAVAAEAMVCARQHGVIVSYDLNYRPSLWKTLGGAEAAQAANRELARHADVLFGNEEDYSVALGYPATNLQGKSADSGVAAYGRLLRTVAADYPNVRLAAVTLRVATTASRNEWGAVAWAGGRLHRARPYHDLEVFDRVGSGDSFASGLIYGLLSGTDVREALDIGAAHGALAMTTPGDTSMATRAEVTRLAAGTATARIER
jgi:2-dehydro-3-deoxygluconokinase